MATWHEVYPKSVLPEELITKVITLYKAGWSMREISQMEPVAYATVSKILHFHKVPIRPQHVNSGGMSVSHKEMEKTIFLYRQGYPLREVARILGLGGPTTVIWRLERAGVKRRPQGGQRGRRRVPKVRTTS